MIMRSCLESSMHHFASKSDDVFIMSLNVICKVLMMVKGDDLTHVITIIIKKLRSDAAVLNERGYTIIKTICTSIDPKVFYEKTAQVLSLYYVSTLLLLTVISVHANVPLEQRFYKTSGICSPYRPSHGTQAQVSEELTSESP